MALANFFEEIKSLFVPNEVKRHDAETTKQDQIGEFVTGLNGHRYYLDGVLSEGEQRIVHAVKGGRFAVKILSCNNRESQEQFSRRLSNLPRLDLESFSVAPPLETLAPPHIGYVMERMRNMVPFKELMFPQKGELLQQWYLGSGGLRRRLRLLGKIAHTFAVLHSQGLAYGDLTPESIFISEDVGSDAVWLIDADNLQYESYPGDFAFLHQFTAPELSSRFSGISTLSDSYAFGVLSFQTLVMGHPFFREMMNEKTLKVEEGICFGKSPWVHEEMKKRENASIRKIISHPLFEAFEKTFNPERSEPFGSRRSEPFKNPGMMEWADILFGEADANLSCPTCGGTFFHEFHNCPWCGNQNPPFYLAMSFLLWDKEEEFFFKDLKGEILIMARAFCSQGEKLLIDKRLAFGGRGQSMINPVISVVFNEKKVQIKNFEEKEYPFFASDGKKRGLAGEKEFFVDIREINKSKIFFEDNQPYCRVLEFTLKKEVFPREDI